MFSDIARGDTSGLANRQVTTCCHYSDVIQRQPQARMFEQSMLVSVVGSARACRKDADL